VAAEATAPRADLHGRGTSASTTSAPWPKQDSRRQRDGTARRVIPIRRRPFLAARRCSSTTAISKGASPYDLSPKDRLTAFTFGCYDLIGEKRNGLLNVLFGSEFYRLDTRYDRQLGPSSKLRSAVTVGFDRTKIPGQPRTARNTQVQARVEATHAVTSTSELRGGADVLFEAYRADPQPYTDPDDPQTQQFDAMFPSRNDITLGAWTDMVLKYPGVTVTPGIRADLYRSGTATAVGIDPRIAARFDVTDRLRLLHTFGIAHQPPSFIIPIPGLAIGSLQGGLQTSLQSSAGVEVDLPDQTTATFTVFDNVFLNMSDALGVQQQSDNDDGFSSQRSLGSAWASRCTSGASSRGAWVASSPTPCRVLRAAWGASISRARSIAPTSPTSR
jgi:hypothetical protein